MHPNFVLNGNNATEDYLPFFFFARLDMNVYIELYVLDGALSHIDSMEENHKWEFYGVLENLPQFMIRSSTMIVCNSL